MAKVTVTETVNAALGDVWASWDDYANIYRFNPNLKGSHLLAGSAPTGLGALRQCDMIDGKNYIREKIVGYEPESKLVIDIYDGTLPMASAVATFQFQSVGKQRTLVTMQMEFKPKFGFLGALMVPLMKPKFRAMLTAMVKANAAYVENGTVVPMAA